MIYTAKDVLPKKKKEHAYYFLAGSMDQTGSKPWRERFYKYHHEHRHFFDPTRTDHGALNDQEMRNHIHWELEALELADTILLNFLPHAKSPISLVELGLYTKSGKLLVVCPDKFYQKRYITILGERYKFPVFNALNQVEFLFA